MNLYRGLGLWSFCIASLVGSNSAYSTAAGIMNGRLAPCPSSPNCVCSYDGALAPFPFRESALDLLRDIIESQPRARVVTSKDGYLHAEFRSRWLHFVDDVEFLVDPKESVVHVRSASRSGYSDFGVNRARIERLAELYLGA